MPDHEPHDISPPRAVGGPYRRRARGGGGHTVGRDEFEGLAQQVAVMREQLATLTNTYTVVDGLREVQIRHEEQMHNLLSAQGTLAQQVEHLEHTIVPDVSMIRPMHAAQAEFIGWMMAKKEVEEQDAAVRAQAAHDAAILVAHDAASAEVARKAADLSAAKYKKARDEALATRRRIASVAIAILIVAVPVLGQVLLDEWRLHGFSHTLGGEVAGMVLLALAIFLTVERLKIEV